MGQFVGLTEQQVCEWVTRYSPDYEYLSGFTDTNGSVMLKCKKCGKTVKRSMVSIRHYKNVQCTECRNKTIAEKKRKHEEYLHFMKRMKRGFHYQQLTMRTCKECGSLFFLEHGNAYYCSKQCANKSANRNKEMKRRMKISDSLIDGDIGLKRLYDRDNGVCWLCGGKCDPNDYTIIDGNFIVGRNYPSIDHVVALANGGEHSWSNVKLAHHICNSLKSDKIFSTPGSFLKSNSALSTDGDSFLCLEP
jgi:DNA-directed RNA polymerase subunit RPC12/RpoP